MASLTCNLSVVNAKDALVFRSLLVLFEHYLTAAWVPIDSSQASFDVEIVDIDEEAGRRVWNGQGNPSVERIALTSNEAAVGPWTLKKPLRPYGSNGLVDVLNNLGRKLAEHRGATVSRDGEAEYTRPLSSAVNLLDAIRKVRAGQKPGMITVPGIPVIFIVPQSGRFYTAASFDEIRKAANGTDPVQIMMFASVAEAETAISLGSVKGAPLELLLWLSGLSALAASQFRTKEGEYFTLRFWPNLPQLPHEPRHQQYSAMFTARPWTVAQVASVTKSATEDVLAFLNACQELDLVERSSIAAPVERVVPAQPQVEQKVGLLRGILRRLGVQRS